MTGSIIPYDFSRNLQKGPLPPPPGGPYDSDMERRVANLEADLKDVKKDLTEIKVFNGKHESSLTHLTSLVARLDNKIPAWWQGPASTGSTLAIVVAILGLAKYFHLF